MDFRFSRAVWLRASFGAVCAAGVLAIIPAAGSATTAQPAVPPGFEITPFASGSSALTKPDDIVRLDGHIFVDWQNGVGSQGEPAPGGGTTSTVTEYDNAGNVVNQWTPTGRVDGIGADPFTHLIYATANEDANTRFYVIDPQAAPASQLRELTINDPSHALSGGPSSTNGGTDAVTVDPSGNVYISASNPDPTHADATAVFLAQVDSPNPGEVTLSRTFADNTPGVNDANNPGATTTLALSDPDSNGLVPSSSPRFANMFALDSQGDGQLVFAPFGFNSSTPGSELYQLTLQPASPPAPFGHPVLDDVRWARHDGGALFVVDQGAGIVYRIKGPFEAGQAFGSQPTDPSNPVFQSDVVSINLSSGTESAFATGLDSPKGLLYVSPSDRSEQGGSEGEKGGHGQESENGDHDDRGDGGREGGGDSGADAGSSSDTGGTRKHGRGHTHRHHRRHSTRAHRAGRRH